MAKPKLNPKPRKPKPAVTLPPGRYLTADGEVTPVGLLAVEAGAAGGWPQGKLASILGLTASTFKKRLGAADTALRLAYERGRYSLEAELTDLLLAQAREGVVVSLLYATKALLGWTDQPQPSKELTNNISIVLPSPMSESEYASTLGRPVLKEIEVLETVAPQQPQRSVVR